MINGIRTGLARLLAPGLRDEKEIAGMIDTRVSEAVTAARQAMPINLDYDPHGDGYRRLSGNSQVRERDLSPMTQELMQELAYYLYDTSGLVKRFVRDSRNFVLGEGFTYSVENDTPQGEAMAILDEFCDDSLNQIKLRLSKRIEFLFLLGEQCWPMQVWPHTGRVHTTYVDPVNIDDVLTLQDFPEVAAAVKLKGSGGRAGRTLSVIREDMDPRSKTYGRLVGDCLFLAVNNPPNSPRGRSDLIHLFDFIDLFENGLYDELEQSRHVKGFVWDVLLKGADETAISNFLAANPPPKPNSIRAHNEQVEWKAVAPDLKHQESKAQYDLVKSYMSAVTNRPDSWLGGGGKAYQTEADLMGEPTFKDLAEQQRFVKAHLEYMLRFVLDQAVIAGRLRESKGERFKITIEMPEMKASDLKKTVDGMFTLAQSLVLATANGWLSKETAAKIYALAASQMGIEVDAAAEIMAAAKDKPKSDDLVTDDYAAREALIDRLTEQVAARMGKSF